MVAGWLAVGATIVTVLLALLDELPLVIELEGSLPISYLDDTLAVILPACFVQVGK